MTVLLRTDKLKLELLFWFKVGISWFRKRFGAFFVDHGSATIFDWDFESFLEFFLVFIQVNPVGSQNTMVWFPGAKIFVFDIEETLVYFLLLNFESAFFQVFQNGLFFISVQSKNVLYGEKVFVLNAGEIELKFWKLNFGGGYFVFRTWFINHVKVHVIDHRKDPVLSFIKAGWWPHFFRTFKWIHTLFNVVVVTQIRRVDLQWVRAFIIIILAFNFQVAQTEAPALFFVQRTNYFGGNGVDSYEEGVVDFG